MMPDLGSIAHFEAEVWRCHREAQRVCSSYNGSWFEPRLKSIGALEITKQLLSTRQIQSGFVDLVAMQRHDLTLEYLVTRPEFRRHFDEDVISEAQRRLGHLAAT
jgi:hypothetical protein